jgi:hypothetical protein
MGGIMHVTGEPAGPQSSVGLPICDLGTGMWAVQGILAALYERWHTGKGPLRGQRGGAGPVTRLRGIVIVSGTLSGLVRALHLVSGPFSMACGITAWRRSGRLVIRAWLCRTTREMIVTE